ncbi:hypothetical protein [Streptomyces sp. YIM S03343]
MANAIMVRPEVVGVLHDLGQPLQRVGRQVSAVVPLPTQPVPHLSGQLHEQTPEPLDGRTRRFGPDRFRHLRPAGQPFAVNEFLGRPDRLLHLGRRRPARLSGHPPPSLLCDPPVTDRRSSKDEEGPETAVENIRDEARQPKRLQ